MKKQQKKRFYQDGFASWLPQKLLQQMEEFSRLGQAPDHRIFTSDNAGKLLLPKGLSVLDNST